MIRLQEFENQKWDANADAADAGRMDRREGSNSYVDVYTKSSIYDLVANL